MQGFDEVAGEHQKVNESLESWRQARRLFYAARRGNLSPNALKLPWHKNRIQRT